MKMTQLHELDIRFKFILITLHSILNLILKFSIEKHKDDLKTDPDLDTRLAKIIFKTPTEKLKKQSFVKDQNYKKHFYLNDNSEKAKVIIRDLDVTVLSNLVTFMKQNSFYKDCRCCRNCNHHKKCKCGEDFLANNCSDKSNCSYSNCSDCVNSQCDYSIIIKFVKICKSFRGSISHLNYDFFIDFESRKKCLNDFPCSKTLVEIWEVINDASINCLEVLLKNNLVDKERVLDYKMDLRIALKKDVSMLVPAIDINHFYKVILGEVDSQKKIKEFEKTILELSKGFYSLNIFLNTYIS